MDRLSDPFDLQRFVDAQLPVYEQVVAELGAGRKQSHWMWFVFPQLRGLGRSPMAERYGITSRAEALAYLRHPVLGPRLVTCTSLVNDVEDRPLSAILGSPDDRKFLSSMTLFAQVAPRASEFVEALRKYADGQLDAATMTRLATDR